MILVWLACAAPAPVSDDPDACGVCHAAHHEAWSVSSHANPSPVFDALRPAVTAAWGDFARQACDDCHTPGGAALGCVNCHAAVGNHAPRDARLAIDLQAPLSGPFGEAAIPTSAHESVKRSFLNDNGLCVTCHDVTGPGLLVETTGTEVTEAGAQLCVICHMPARRDALTADTPTRDAHDHRMIGFDPPAEADEAADAETRDLLARALSLEVAPAGDDAWVIVVTAGDTGHSVPTGVGWLRDLWVEADGERVLQIGDQPLRDGSPTPLLTDADTLRRGALAPGASVRVVVRGDAPTVRLLGRAVRPEVEEALGLDLDLPVHVIAAWPLISGSGR